MDTVREPAVAGYFYPEQAARLKRVVDGFLDEAGEPEWGYSRMVLAPHAGYEYSGKFAASAYRAVDPKTKRVVILGPAHRVALEAMALSGAHWHRTPLGMVPVDEELTSRFMRLPGVITLPLAHAEEHSLEVHLPFLQRQIEGEFAVVPVAGGRVDPRKVAELLKVAWEDPGTTILISSDLSHYFPERVATVWDLATIQKIGEGNGIIVPTQACGAYPLSGAVRFADQQGLTARCLSRGTSADTDAGEDQVVGYASMAWYPGVVRQYFQDSFMEELPEIAHRAISGEFEEQETKLPDLPVNPDFGGVFVTITIDGQLRGCIGSFEGGGDLVELVRQNAVEAAFFDPRFPPLTQAELGWIETEVSVLTPPVPLNEAEGRTMAEEEILSRLLPRVHGVLLQKGKLSATYLPQVWDGLPDPGHFLRSLKEKAGLEADYWGPDIIISTYRAYSFLRGASG